jgi:hypothetical protein
VRLLEPLVRRANIDGQPARSLTMSDWAKFFSFDGHQYITGASGSRPDQVDGSFVDHIQKIHNRHGIVAAAVEARALLMSQVRFKFRRVDGTLYGNRDLSILERPGSTTRPAMLKALEYDVSYSGTGVVGRRGNRLFRLSPAHTTFVLASESEPSWDGELLTAPFDAETVGVIYDASHGRSSGHLESFQRGEFAVYAPEPDPLHPWRGLSWVTSVVREIMLDGQVTSHEGKFFENAATPSLVFLMDPSKSPEQTRQYAEVVNENHAGAMNAHKNMFLGGATDVKVVGSTLQDIGLDGLQGTYENRVAVRSRIPAVVLGTKESLGGSSLNAGNYAAARRLLADGWFAPTVDGLCAALESVIRVPNDGTELSYDADRVLFLQEDAKDAADITSTQAATIGGLVREGFTPESATAAVKTGDVTKLVHTGLVSVQLQEPGANNNTTEAPSSATPTP